MFHDLSIQKDDPVITNSAIITTTLPDLKLIYLRHLHLYHTLTNSEASASLSKSYTASIISLLSPLVPKGNWTTGDTPPQPSEFFYRAFPKVSPDMDNDYHVNNPGVFWGWFHLSRWLPNLIQRILFPFDNVVNKIPRKLTGQNTPTRKECELCEKFKGVMVWNRKGDWYCIYDDVEVDDVFPSFNDFMRWKQSNLSRLQELEKLAYNAKDMNELKKIEIQIDEIETRMKTIRRIKPSYIVSING